MKWQREAINSMIEDSILEADAMGVQVLSLGLLNQASNRVTTGYFCIINSSTVNVRNILTHVMQGEELNKNGELFLNRHPQLKVKLVDGSSLAVAVVLNSLPKGITEVVIRGNLSKVAYSIVVSLCQEGTQV